MVNIQNRCQCSPQAAFKQQKLTAMNKPSLLFLCYAYTELQIRVDCKILLKGKQGCFRAPVIHNVYTSSLNIHVYPCTNTYIEFSCLKGMEIQTLKTRKRLPFSCNYFISFLSSHVHRSRLLIHVLILNSFMFKSQSAMLLVVRSTLTLPAQSIKGTTGCIFY